MLKVVVDISNRRTLFLGLERNNTERIHKDEPIVIDLQALTAQMDGPVQDLVIVAAETPREVHAMLSVHFHRIGVELPPYKEVGKDDPAYVFRRQP